MNVTESRFKNRQLHMEDYLQMVSAEQKEYAEVFDYSKITEKSGVITDYWTNNLLDLILRKDNLNNAYKQVRKNKGKGGIDGMQVDELLPFLRENQETLIRKIREGKYKPNPVRRVEIPKETKGEFRKLGVPTVVDRVIQQAIAQELSPIYEEQFSENSFGFRPKRGAHVALRQCQKNVNDGYVYVVDMDVEKFFDMVCQSKLIEVLSRTIKDEVHSFIKDNIDYDVLLQCHPTEKMDINELVELMVETIAVKQPVIRINKYDFPYDVVRSRLEKIDFHTMEYVLECLRNNTTKVRNIRSYMLTTLYNAPVTCSNYYKAEVNHDFYGK